MAPDAAALCPDDNRKFTEVQSLTLFMHRARRRAPRQPFATASHPAVVWKFTEVQSLVLFKRCSETLMQGLPQAHAIIVSTTLLLPVTLADLAPVGQAANAERTSKQKYATSIDRPVNPLKWQQRPPDFVKTRVGIEYRPRKVVERHQ